MGSMSAETRCMVAIKYKQMFEKELKDVMKSECGKKDFGTALQFLAQPPDAAEAGMIHKACSGIGTNELNGIQKLFIGSHTFADLFDHITVCLVHRNGQTLQGGSEIPTAAFTLHDCLELLAVDFLVLDRNLATGFRIHRTHGRQETPLIRIWKCKTT
jgi:hypothetical protein